MIVGRPTTRELFESPLPDNLTGLSGRAEGQDKAVVERINDAPQNYYVSISSTEFPPGAVRGQLDAGRSR